MNLESRIRKLENRFLCDSKEVPDYARDVDLLTEEQLVQRIAGRLESQVSNQGEPHNSSEDELIRRLAERITATHRKR